jgi:hypothetical protein
MRRYLAPLVATSLLMLLPAAVLRAAAAPVSAGKQVTVEDCLKPKSDPQYATVEVNMTVLHVGDPIKISGIGYCPHEDVDLTIDGRHVGTAHTDAAGSFERQATTLRGPPGQRQVCGLVVSGPPTDRDCLLVRVLAANGSRAAPPGHDGDTVSTGVRIALVGLLALVLVVGGVVVTTLTRNRRPDRA